MTLPLIQKCSGERKIAATIGLSHIFVSCFYLTKLINAPSRARARLPYTPQAKYITSLFP